MFSFLPETTATNLNQLLISLFTNIFVVILLVIFAILAWSIIKHLIQKKRGLSGTLLLISLPRWDEASDVTSEKTAGPHAASAQAAQMFAELHGLTKHGVIDKLLPSDIFSFEIVATSELIKFYLFCLSCE